MHARHCAPHPSQDTHQALPGSLMGMLSPCLFPRHNVSSGNAERDWIVFLGFRWEGGPRFSACSPVRVSLHPSVVRCDVEAS